MPSSRQLPSASVLQHPHPAMARMMQSRTVGRFIEMTRLPVLIMVSVLAAAPRASAACRWLGTRLECDVGASRVVIGTQAADEPTYARSFPIRSCHGASGLPD